MKQRSIKKGFELQGIGLHSGVSCKINVSPAKEDTGTILNSKKATVENVSNTNRGTTVAGVAVTEHFLAAAYGLGIDNLLVEIEGGEFPALDGSALPYVEALEKAGIVELAADKNFIKLKFPVEAGDKETWLKARPCNGFRVHFMVDFLGIGEQNFVFEDQFETGIAPARTVGYLKEHEALKKQGLALGASLDNALVIGKDGYLNKPRFPDEIVRHKILDLIGDLALLGRPLEAEIFAQKSGHRHNIELVRRILENDRA